MSNVTTVEDKLPDGFIPVETQLPAHDRPVLVIRKSDYICSTYEVLTGRFMPDYRPKSPWRDISSDAISDSGSEVLGWREMPEWFHREISQ